MGSETSAYCHILSSNIHLIIIAFFGGLILFGMKCSEHFMRSEQDKMPASRYAIFFLSLLIILPLLGAFITSVYLVNGDKLSPILALQVGLTSPAIVQSLVIAAVNNIAKKNSPVTVPGQ